MILSSSESASQGDESSEDRFRRLVPLASHAQPTFPIARGETSSLRAGIRLDRTARVAIGGQLDSYVLYMYCSTLDGLIFN